MIDVGSNSVRMVVFEGDRRSPAQLFNEKVMCRLGARIGETGRLDPAGRARAMAALRRFAAIAGGMRVGALAAVATAAVREAADGAEFCAEIRRRTNIRVEIASGADEARLAAQGVLFGNPRAEGVVVDLGGASLELCRVGGGRVGQGVSVPLGPLRLTSAGPDGLTDAQIAAEIEGLAGRFGVAGGRLHLVGGAWRSLARAQMERVDYPLKVLHEYTLGAAAARELGAWVAAMRPDKLKRLRGISEERAPLLPVAGRLLCRLIEGLGPGEVMFSGFGLREGLCIEHLPAPVRARDPLIAACEAVEGLAARAPGFGAELAAWAKTVLAPLDAGEERLVEAAARLADVNWRTHPDYRVSGSWEAATRATLTDIGHAGRVFLGTALTARHKRGRRRVAESRLMKLLDPDTLDRAIRYGLVFGLGAALSGATPGVLGSCRMVRAPGRLDLVLEGPAEELAGEEVEKRLRNLTVELGVAGELRAASGREAARK
ncbi:MAG TPA: exopolyphosphatase [Thermohalobaculum sp.]|nr:exopolyphosphatase [Thermohalobaculum sp.]